MAAFDFSAAQTTASMAEGQQASLPIQSLPMQINADAVCLIRTQFQHVLQVMGRLRLRTLRRRTSCVASPESDGAQRYVEAECSPDQVANTDPRNAPIPAVTAIAKALQNVTRTTPRITFAFPT